MDEEDELIESDDYYAWLGLSKDASRDEINNAFRKQSRIYHPDKHGDTAELQQKAELLFTKIKKAHEVLSDPHRKMIYDTMGVKGLETEGWEVVSRTKTPREIMEEYEQLAREREERKLQQKTNPKGSISVGVDATDCFDRYPALDALEYQSMFPSIEINSMSISQSVEAPLTVKDTVMLNGNLSSQNGTGSGTIGASYRRVMSHKSWAEVECGAGNGFFMTVRGFRTLFRRGHGTMSGTFQMTERGIRPSINTMVAVQLDKNVQGRIMWNVGVPSSLMTSVVYDNQNHHLSASIQLGIPHSYVTVNYSHRFTEQDAKVRGAVRLGTFGFVVEYGCEKKISQFSVLGASMIIGAPSGITLKIKLNRGNQMYQFPIRLSDEIVPSAVFYGTVVPLIAYVVVSKLLVAPFIKGQKETDLRRKREANAERMAEKMREAEAAVELMRVTVDRSFEAEGAKGGLVLCKALYGKLEGEDLRDNESINVTRPLQALVKDSRLYLQAGAQLSEMPGFYDPCVGENKQLCITYEFRQKMHQCKYNEKDKIVLPNKEHACDASPTPSSSST